MPRSHKKRKIRTPKITKLAKNQKLLGLLCWFHLYLCLYILSCKFIFSSHYLINTS